MQNVKNHLIIVQFFVNKSAKIAIPREIVLAVSIHISAQKKNKEYVFNVVIYAKPVKNQNLVCLVKENLENYHTVIAKMDISKILKQINVKVIKNNKNVFHKN